VRAGGSGVSGRSSRTALAVLAAIGFVMVPGAAGAKSAGVSTLPQGALPTSAPAKPLRIDGKEKVAAIAARREPRVGVPSHVVLEAEGDHRACFQTFANGAAAPGAQDRVFAYPQGEVVGARMEQIVVDPQTDKARLEMTDVFLDPRTLGVRGGNKAQIDLATVARGPGLARVYAFREAGGAIGVLVPTGARGTFRDTKGALGASTCGHVRLTFAPESPNAASVIASLDVPEPKLAADPFARGKPPPPSANAMAAAVAAGNEPKAVKLARVFQISVSVTRTSRDPEPLLAVSIGLPPGDAGPTPQSFPSDVRLTE
jgi:hypothetical protein